MQLIIWVDILVLRERNRKVDNKQRQKCSVRQEEAKFVRFSTFLLVRV